MPPVGPASSSWRGRRMPGSTMPTWPTSWPGGRGSLVAGIADPTGLVTGAAFRLSKDAAGYCTMLTQTANRPGLPSAIRSDCRAIFLRDPNRPPTLAEQLTGQRRLSQVGWALDELDAAQISARSPRKAVGSSDRGGRSRTGSSPSSDSRGSRRSRRPTPSCLASSSATPRGSRSPQPSPRRPGLARGSRARRRRDVHSAGATPRHCASATPRPSWRRYRDRGR